MDEDWGDYYATTFLQIDPRVSPQSVMDKLTQIHIKHQPGPDASKVKYLSQSLTKIHLYNPNGSEGICHTKWSKIFLIVGSA